MEQLIAQDTAGSPVDEGLRWTNRSPAELTTALQKRGIAIGVDALRRILFDELGLSRRQAFKDEAACCFPQRNAQFQYIAQLRAQYERQDCPVLSVDTKKKEILGNFFHPGRALTDGRVIVQDHDFVISQQRLVPYGVFDTRRNERLRVAESWDRHLPAGLRCDLALVATAGKATLPVCSAFAVAVRLRRQQRQPSTSVQRGVVLLWLPT